MARLVRKWAPVAAAAILLALISEGLWLWQSWPVRQLLLGGSP